MFTELSASMYYAVRGVGRGEDEDKKNETKWEFKLMHHTPGTGVPYGASLSVPHLQMGVHRGFKMMHTARDPRKW